MKMKKMMVFVLCLIMALFVVACGPEPTPTPTPTPTPSADNAMSDWKTQDLENIKNLVQKDKHGLTFDYATVTKASYKNVFMDVTNHKKAKNMVEMSITNKSAKEAHFLVCLEDASGGDKAIYNGYIIAKDETKVIKTFMYVDETKFTGELSTIKMFPNSSGDAVSGNVNGSVIINSVELKTETPPAPPVTDSMVGAPTTTSANITITGNAITFTYTENPVDTYQAIVFAISEYTTEYNKFKITIQNTGATAFTLGYKATTDKGDGYVAKIEVAVVAGNQIFTDWAWGSAAEVTNITAIELFVNSNGDAIPTTLTGAFTITLELIKDVAVV